MSTKSSLVLVNWQEQHEVHIYNEMIDGCYYIETNQGKLKIPKEIAEKFSNVLKEYENKACSF